MLRHGPRDVNCRKTEEEESDLVQQEIVDAELFPGCQKTARFPGDAQLKAQEKPRWSSVVTFKQSFQ